MENYNFNVISYRNKDSKRSKTLLMNRPVDMSVGSFKDEAQLFFPGDKLEEAINTSIALGEPLLITGEPGTGKTQAAYYVAYKLGLQDVLHFQVKSDSNARDLLYHFDTIEYFHDSHMNKEDGEKVLDKSNHVYPRVLWTAMESPEPRVVLIDEIDKAPRDFPNDLLHELNKMEFTVVETGQKVTSQKSNHPIVFITSNSERRLPEPFLRRCVYHHIRFDEDILKVAADNRETLFKDLGKPFIDKAREKFMELRQKNLRKKPSTGEFLVWLYALALSGKYSKKSPNEKPKVLSDKLADLDFLSVLVKDHQDLEDLQKRG